MSNPVIIHKGRTMTLQIGLGENISADTFTSQIRTEPDVNATLLLEWDVSFTTDGTDGELTLVADNLDTGQVTVDTGYMDLKRMAGTEPLPVFDRPLEVSFIGVVTE